MKPTPKWMEYCKYCGKKHRVTLKQCPGCFTYLTPQPVSEKVTEQCMDDYYCDGCDAYKDHLR